MIIYVDTSAVLKLLVAEKESDTLADYLSGQASAGTHLVASMLLYTELHCAARRRGIPAEPVNTVLSGINLVDVARSDHLYAAAMPGRLRSADAIHLASAIRLQADALIAYDAELLAAAVDAGMNVVAPK